LSRDPEQGPCFFVNLWFNVNWYTDHFFYIISIKFKKIVNGFFWSFIIDIQNELFECKIFDRKSKTRICKSVQSLFGFSNLESSGIKLSYFIDYF
jgi:hypothetical protein